MNIQEKLVRDLVQLGLTRHEALVYIALSARYPARAREVSEISGIPSSHVYDTLNSLVAKGVVELIPTEPRQYRPLVPELAIGKLHDEMISKIDGAKDSAVEGLKGLVRAASFHGTNSSVIVTKRVMRHLIVDILNRSITSICIATSTPDLLDDPAIRASLRSAAQRGVNLRLIVRQLDLYSSLERDGLSPRYVDRTPPGFTLVSDNKEAIIAPIHLDSASPYGPAIWVKDEKLAKQYAEYFEYIWTEHYRLTLSRLRARRIEDSY